MVEDFLLHKITKRHFSPKIKSFSNFSELRAPSLIKLIDIKSPLQYAAQIQEKVSTERNICKYI